MTSEEINKILQNKKKNKKTTNDYKIITANDNEDEELHADKKELNKNSNKSSLKDGKETLHSNTKTILNYKDNNNNIDKINSTKLEFDEDEDEDNNIAAEELDSLKVEDLKKDIIDCIN